MPCKAVAVDMGGTLAPCAGDARRRLQCLGLPRGGNHDALRGLGVVGRKVARFSPRNTVGGRLVPPVRVLPLVVQVVGKRALEAVPCAADVRNHDRPPARVAIAALRSSSTSAKSGGRLWPKFRAREIWCRFTPALFSS